MGNASIRSVALAGLAFLQVWGAKVTVAQEETSKEPSLEFLATHPDLSGNEPHWRLDPKSQCWIFDRHPESSDTVVWLGGCKDGLASGQGKQTWWKDRKIQEILEGEFTNGSVTGIGEFTFRNGFVYRGEMIHSFQHGEGTLFMPLARRRYVGQWPGPGNLIDLFRRKCPAVATYEDDQWKLKLDETICKR